MIFKKLFRGGVHPKHHKNTAKISCVEMPPPKQICLFLSQHIGAACEPLVKKGDMVKVGTKVADSPAFVSAPIHSGVSGKVKNIVEMKTVQGRSVQAIVIDSDDLMEVDENIKPPEIRNTEDFCNAVRESGLVGLGGAGFPTHVKIRPIPNKIVDTLVINAAECEPFLTVDDRLMVEESNKILDGITHLCKWLGYKTVYIGVEDNKSQAIECLKKSIAERQPTSFTIQVLSCPSIYPQGAEKTLVYACTKKEIPLGGLPSDIGVCVMNVASAAFIASYMETGMPLVKRALTFDGDIVKQPMNIIAPFGTKIADIVDFAGGITEEVDLALMGGPMMGFAMADLDNYLLKNNNGILLLNEKSAPFVEETACIRCGKCSDVCPMNLLPKGIVNNVIAQNNEKLAPMGLAACIECGCCSYTCPAHIPLVHYLKLGKQEMRKVGGR